MISSPRLRAAVLAFCVFLFALGPAAWAQQPVPPVDSFDLVLLGDSLMPAAHQLELKTNPTAGDTWTTLDQTRCTGTGRLMVIPDLAAHQYLGQDLHNYYAALRVTAKTAGGTLRAAYAVPSIEYIDDDVCTQLLHLVETQPMLVRQHSLAVYERPRPVRLRPDSPFVDHVEAPVRHRKPGVTSVAWMEILFRPTN